MENSHLVVTENKIRAYVGPDATNLFRAKVLKTSLMGYAKFKMLPTRGVSAANMLTMATQYTGKTYKRGQYEIAAADIAKWCETMTAALPVVQS